MAERPVFLPVFKNGKADIQAVTINFNWFPGFSLSQKQRSIQSLHSMATEQGICKQPLEISSKSPTPLGRKLSAFFLELKLPNGFSCPIECAFQGGKVFESSGPFLDFLNDPHYWQADVHQIADGVEHLIIT